MAKISWRNFFNLSGSENLKKQGSEKRIFFARLDFSKLPVANTLANSEGNTSGNSVAIKIFFSIKKNIEIKGL